MEIKEFKAQTTEKNEKNTKRKIPEKYGTKHFSGIFLWSY